MHLSQLHKLNYQSSTCSISASSPPENTTGVLVKLLDSLNSGPSPSNLPKTHNTIRPASYINNEQVSMFSRTDVNMVEKVTSALLGQTACNIQENLAALHFHGWSKLELDWDAK